MIDRGSETKAEGSRYRRTIGPWRNADVARAPLAMHTLSTRLTQIAAYRGTICAVGEEAYLVGRLNAMPQPAVARVIAARTELADAIAGLIPLLHWAEFELLVDLLFTRSGWRRVTVLGGTMKDIDLLVEQPVTGERIAVQVKSKATQAVLDACAEAHAANGLADRFYFVCHSQSGPLVAPTGGEGRVMLWQPAEIALQRPTPGLPTG